METSPSDFQFLDSGSLTSDMKPVDLKVSEGKCPICWQNNKIRKLIPVYYKMREAIYTCEDPNVSMFNLRFHYMRKLDSLNLEFLQCLFFITDDFGNLQKFTKTNGSLNYSKSQFNITGFEVSNYDNINFTFFRREC